MGECNFMVYLKGVVQLDWCAKRKAHAEAALSTEAPLPLKPLPLHSPLKLIKQKETTVRTSSLSHVFITWVRAWKLLQTTHSASGVVPSPFQWTRPKGKSKITFKERWQASEKKERLSCPGPWHPAPSAAYWPCHCNSRGFHCLSLCVWSWRGMILFFLWTTCLTEFLCFRPVWLCLFYVRHYITKMHMPVSVPLRNSQYRTGGL